MHKLKDRIAVVTGATSGIGLAVARLLVADGVKVYLIGRDFNLIKKELENNKLPSAKAYFVHMDFNSDEEILNILNETENETTVDLLIHCAGVISVGLMEHETIEHFDEQYRVNVRAPYLLTQALLPKIKKAAGDIVFINSTTGLDSWEEVGQYAATKHALKAVADSLRKELKRDKVRVSSLYLGSVNTPMQQKVHQLKGKKTYSPEKYMSADVIADTVMYLIRMPKQASVTDITIRQNI